MQTTSSSIKPLERFQVNDGLLLTAKLWRQAHDYHRQRQNIYYQSLHQPGIVSGLGVCIIDAPQEVAGQYKDQRWLKVQPGVAIDVNGNPIIVPRSLTFRIASDAPKSGDIIVYVVISYVDPDRLQIERNSQLVTETFRIDEKTTQLDADEVELCRILLQPGGVELVEASNVLSPQVNNLDLRFRKQAQFRALEQVRIGYFQHREINRFEDNKFENNLFSLCRSVPTLYPKMEVQPIKLFDLTDNINELNCDLIYFEYQDFINLQALKLEQLQQFIKTGAVIVVEVSALEANIAELDSVKQQLQTTIKNLSHQPEIIQVRQELRNGVRRS